MNKIAKAIGALGMAVAGMAGLYFNVEYSGWVLAIGCLLAVGLVDD